MVRTLEDVRRVSFWQYGLYGWIFGTIGVVGLLLAAVGVYGVLSYSVSQRTQEIGVRVALGASRGHVLRLIVGQGLLLAGIGVAIGLALAASGTPLARSLLYNVSPFDPFTFIRVSIFLVAVAFLASFVRRGARRESIHSSRCAASDSPTSGFLTLHLSSEKNRRSEMINLWLPPSGGS